MRELKIKLIVEAIVRNFLLDRLNPANGLLLDWKDFPAFCARWTSSVGLGLASEMTTREEAFAKQYLEDTATKWIKQAGFIK